MQGVVKALALQGKVIPFNLTAFWLINVPLACFFSFYLKLGFGGVWMAMIVA